MMDYNFTVYTLHREEENDHNLGHMFVSLMEKQYGLEIDSDKFISDTAIIRSQPIDGQHIEILPVDIVVEYLKSEHLKGKTQILFYGSDEMMQDFSLAKVQEVAEEVKDLFHTMVYLIDEFNIELYDQWCLKNNREPVLTILGGIHFAYHQTQETDSVYNFVNNKNRPYKFLFYSRMPRTVRLQLLGDIFKNNLENTGLISAFPEDNIFDSIKDKQSQFPELTHLIKNKDKFPLTIDTDTPWDCDFNLCGIIDNNYQHTEKSYFSLVSETVFYKNLVLGLDNTHMGGSTFTEKTFRPMCCWHPFVLVARPHSLKRLRKYGFETFYNWWDESYDSEENDRERYFKISKLLTDLCSISVKDWDMLIQEMLPVLEHNARLMNQTVFDFTVTKDSDKIKKFLKV